jgi:outer membrane protein TolC
LIPELEIGKRQAANRLCILLGMPPRDLDAMLGAGSGVPVAPSDVVVGVPADLLRRRPDVRRAERMVAAQSARIGIAVSDLYPHLSVLGTIGIEAEQFGDLFRSGSMIGEISPGFSWDILNYGRLVNNVRVQDARFQELAYGYQNQVLSAGQEVEDAIVAFLRFQEQAQHLGESVRAAARPVEITDEQYNEGAVDFTTVYVFQQNLTEQQDAFAVAQGNIAQSLIDVYRALGGGWQIRLGGNAPQVVEPETSQQPSLEQMPLPSPDNDVQIESFPAQASFLDLPRVETAAQETGPCATPATQALRPSASDPRPSDQVLPYAMMLRPAST